MGALFVLMLLTVSHTTVAQDESYGLSYLAAHLNKYCQISSPKDSNCEKQSVHFPPPDDKGFRVGKAGPRGPPGPPGIVDDDVMNKKLDAKLAEYAGFLEKLRGMEQFITNAKLGRCQVIYNEKCFWFVDSKVNYAQGRELCLQVGATPANVYSEKHYGMLVKHVRGLQKGTTEPWVGMTYNHKSRTAAYHNGTIVEFSLTWHPGYPSNHAARTQLNLSVRQEATETRQGMWNTEPSSTEEGIICEI